MSYDFSFSGKTISFVVGGAAFVGLMLFIAGLLVGASWNAEPKAVDRVDKVAGQPPVVAAPTPASTPAPAAPEPVVTADAATPEATAPVAAQDAPGGASLPVKQAHGSAASVNSRRSSVPTPTPPNDGELRVVEEAEPSPGEANKPPAL
jgi:hypothetical protein